MAESNTQYSDDTPSHSSSVDSPPAASDGIVMVSPPDTQGVFHTPLEESSLPSSDDGVDRCAVNHAVYVDAGSQVIINFCDGSEFVDLGKDSDLGFSEVQLTQEMNVEEGMGSFKGKLVSEENEISMNKNKNCSKKVACTVEEGKKSSDGVVEASGMRKSGEDPGKLRVLPPSICGRSENAAATRMERGDNSREKMNAFDVLRFLSLNSDDVEENLDHLSLLDMAKARGVTFPRPRWWPDDDKFEP